MSSLSLSHRNKRLELDSCCTVFLRDITLPGALNLKGYELLIPVVGAS